MPGIIYSRTRCNVCHKFVPLQNLGYVKSCAAHPSGTDICIECADSQLKTKEIKLNQLQPAADWITYSPKETWIY